MGPDVIVTLHAADPMGNASMTTLDSFRLCGKTTNVTASAVNNIGLGMAPAPRLGTTSTLAVAGAPVKQAGVLLLGIGRTNLPLVGGTLHVGLHMPT